MKQYTPRSGQTLLMFTLAIIPLFGITGLVVDIGWAYFRHEAAQTAADAAANAAAGAAFASAGSTVPLCTTPGVACYATPYTCPATLTSPAADNILVGCMYAASNGFPSTGRQTVTFQSGVGNAPNASGVTVGYWVVARVSEGIPQLFSAVLGRPLLTVTARTTTGDRPANGGGCVIALNPSASGAISMSGSAAIQTGCGVYVDSSSASAISMSGGAAITTTGTAKTEIHGGWNGGGSISPAPQTGVSNLSDPFVSMAAPTVGACTDGGSGINLSGGQTQTINPGVLCGGIHLSGSSALTLNPGLYIVKSGINLSGGTSLKMTGTAGVTIYIESGAVSMSGGSIVNLSAPSSGVWQGILMFQNRADSLSSNLTGGTAQLMNGLIYFPSAALTYSGGSSTNSTASSVVANTITLTGNSYINAAAITTYSGNIGGVVMIE